MVKFDLWREAFLFACIYAPLILIPCTILAFMGKGVIDRLGHWPSKSPAIHMSVCLKLLVLEVVTFLLLIGFYQALFE